jgi:hypothetical protein
MTRGLKIFHKKGCKALMSYHRNNKKSVNLARAWKVCISINTNVHEMSVSCIVMSSNDIYDVRKFVPARSLYSWPPRPPFKYMVRIKNHEGSPRLLLLSILLPRRVG